MRPVTFVEGTVIDIVYRSDETSYTVLELDVGGRLLVCVGNLPPIQPGEYVRFYGAYTTHRNYGEQFKVASMEARMPEGDESIKMFLAGGLIKGVGEVLADRIVEQFHEETFAVIEEEPERLAQVKGVSANAAKKIQAQFIELKAVRGIVMELQQLGLTVKQAMSAYDAYGQAAAHLIRQNPYRLVDDIRGIGFEKADAIAQGMELDNYWELRLYNGIKYVLRTKLDAGHTCYPKDRLTNEAAALLEASQEEVEEAIAKLIAQGDVAQNTYNGVSALAWYPAYNAESYAAYKLVKLAHAKPHIAVDDSLAEGLLLEDTLLSEEQERAILAALHATVYVITGGPGTGKTTILNQLITILERSGIKTVLAAPTGRAAKRMEKSTAREAKTRHRLLEYGANPIEDSLDSCRFARDEENPIEAEAIVIDETSMVDIFLFRSLLAAIQPGTRLLLIGDFDQLPSVGPGNVLKDVIVSGKLPVARLTEVFRTQGNIALNAHRINRGEPLDLYQAGDCVFMPARTPDETLEIVKRQYWSRLEEGVSLDEVQVICPVKKGRIGVYTINQEIREMLNPRLAEKNELSYGDTIFREGDKVMQITNNYSKDWYLEGTLRVLGRGQGAFNGDIGMIRRIDTGEKTLEILFDGERVAQYSQNELEQLEHAYAVTVHKSQGSEFDTVILPLFYGNNEFLTRNLLYTAMTRAKKRLVIVGLARTVQHMVQNSRVSRRFTALKYEIASYDEFFERLSRGETGIPKGYEKIDGLFR